MNVFLNDEKLEKVWEAIRKNFFPVPPESGTAQPPTPAMEGDVTIAFGRFTSGDYIGYLNSIVSTIGNKKVTTAKIDDLAVTTIKLADDAVETAKIKNLAVTTAKIADSAITQAKLALGAIAPTVIWLPGTSNGPTLTIQAGKDTSAAVAIPKASDTASGVVTTAAQSFAGDKTFKGEVYGEKNIQAMRGVAAGGYADLSMSSGGGSGTVVAISVNGVTKEPVAGLITLDDYPLLSVYNSDKTGILNRLTVIEGKIPADASSSNQLADKAFVNSSINTATATHQGTYDVVNDLHLTASATHEQVAAALLTAVASRNPDKNDYVFVSFPATASAAGRFDRYKYDGTAWGYEYTLNNSSFTSAQWAAITSGITMELVAAFNAKYDKPSGGIPKSDLASDVQTSLGKADTALQTHQTIYDLVIQKNGVKVGNTYNPATGDQIINMTDVASDADVTTLKGYFTNGVAKNAARLSNTAKIGDTNQPVYFTANGVPTPISYTIGRNVAANEDVTPYTAGDSIDITGHVVKVSMAASDSPSASGNAIAFIDTISQNAAGKISATKKTIHTASATQLGLVKVGTGLSISEGVLSIGTGGVTNAMLANSKITIGTREVSLGGTLAISTLASDVSTQLGLKSAALHEHGDYVTALGVNGKTVTWSKGGTAQTAITVPYAKESTTLETETMQETQEFIFRNSPKTIGADSLKLDRILGRTLVWNQRVNRETSPDTNGTKTRSGYIDTITGGSYAVYNGVYGGSGSAPSGHTYYIAVRASATNGNTIQFGLFWSSAGRAFATFSPALTTTLAKYSVITTNKSYDVSWGNVSVRAYWSGGDRTIDIGSSVIIDLTLFFNGNIPTGLTAETFERDYGYLFVNPTFDEGQLINNSAEGLETVGFNLWDEEWENGYYGSDGSKGDATYIIRSVNYTKVLPNQTYYLKIPNTTIHICEYGVDKNFISRSLTLTGSGTIMFGTNTAYIRFCIGTTGNPVMTYNNDICINISDPSKNGQYEPYKRNVLDLHLEEFKVKDSQGNIITITGGLKQAGNVRDEIVGNKYIRRVGSVDLGTLPYSLSYPDSYHLFTVNYMQNYVPNFPSHIVGGIGAISTKFTNTTWSYIAAYTTNGCDKVFCLDDASMGSDALVIRDTTYSDAATFKAAMSGELLYYELATYETYELVSPIPTAMPAGTTERRLPEDTSDSVLAPFCADMTYGTNPGDILASGIAWERIWGKPHTLAELGLDDMFIKHDKSNQSLTKLDRHLIKVGDQDLYLIFNAEADGSFTLRVATGLNNGTYENEQAFSLSTITDEQINAICHL